MIHIIGIGIDGRQGLPPETINIIERSALLVGGRRQLAEFSNFTGKKVPIGSDLENIITVLSEHLGSCPFGNAVVLSTGDPDFFGISDFLVNRLGKENIDIFPNVTVMQSAFAKIKESWNNACFFSVHGRKMDIESIAERLKDCTKAGFFTDRKNNPQLICRLLYGIGMTDFRAFVFEDMGTGSERIIAGSLKDMGTRQFSPLNVLLLLRKGNVNRNPGRSMRRRFPIGIDDSMFSHTAGIITKSEIRVVTISKLEITDRTILWDIGAGCGSISVEAALIATNGQVFSIERNKKQVEHIRRNIKKFYLNNIDVIEGDAAECLSSLVKPDAVFIGGGSYDIPAILKKSAAALRTGGKIAVNAVTVETLELALHSFRKVGLESEVTLMNVSRSRPLIRKGESKGKLSLMKAENPVFIISGKKNSEM